jgi:hypothetical protein
MSFWELFVIVTLIELLVEVLLPKTLADNKTTATSKQAGK